MKYLLTLFLMVVAASAYADTKRILVTNVYASETMPSDYVVVIIYDSNSEKKPVQHTFHSGRELSLIQKIEGSEKFKAIQKASRFSIYFDEDGNLEKVIMFSDSQEHQTVFKVQDLKRGSVKDIQAFKDFVTSK